MAGHSQNLKVLTGLEKSRFREHPYGTMPEPVLAISLIAGHAALQSLTLQGTATSSLAREVRSNAVIVTEYVERSVALYGAKSEALAKLHSIAAECSYPDWDGYGAEAVHLGALQRAEMFLRSLPEDFPLPEFSVEPDGAISFDWLPTRTRSFSLSIGEFDRIAYAWLDGTDRGHAVARVSPGEIPGRILEELSRIVHHASAIRAA